MDFGLDTGDECGEERGDTSSCGSGRGGSVLLSPVGEDGAERDSERSGILRQFDKTNGLVLTVVAG